MQIFLYEYLTGGGLFSDALRTSNTDSLALEGRAMCAALSADFAAIDGVQVTCLRDSRLVGWKPHCQQLTDVRNASERDAAFDRCAASADRTVVIAPEIDGALLKLSRRVGAVGGHLLGGPLPFIQLAADKHATAEYLKRSGVPVPRGMLLQLGQAWPIDFPYPAIWKPLDGAGSQGIRRIDDCQAPIPQTDPRPGRLEELCPKKSVGIALSRRAGIPGSEMKGRFTFPGIPARRERAFPAESARKPLPMAGVPASVTFLCGPARQVALPPCRQYLADDFRYLGGSLPLLPDLAERATRLARRAVASLPEPLGYLGVDLVLGVASDGRDDVVIEINPRLTTSYIGLRAACRQSLAAAMLAIAAGSAYNLSFHGEFFDFRADGTLGRMGFLARPVTKDRKR